MSYEETMIAAGESAPGEVLYQFAGDTAARLLKYVTPDHQKVFSDAVKAAQAGDLDSMEARSQEVRRACRRIIPKAPEVTRVACRGIRGSVHAEPSQAALLAGFGALRVAELQGGKQAREEEAQWQTKHLASLTK